MNIFLLTDDQSIPKLVTAAIEHLCSQHKLTWRRSMNEAWKLFADATTDRQDFPDLIVFDFELSRNHEHELIQVLKFNAATKGIPLIVFSNSMRPEEVREIYDYHAACIIHMPASPIDRLRRICASLKFWSNHVVLPPRRAAPCAREAAICAIDSEE